MRIELGQGVRSRDGRAIGSIVGLVVDGRTFEVTRLLVGHGRGEPPRMVDASAATATDGGNVGLDLTAESFAAMPELVSRETTTGPRVPEFPIILPAGGVGGPVLADVPDTGPGYPDSGSFFDLAPLDPPAVEVQSNLLTSEVVLHKGSDVVSSDGHKVGTLDEVSFGEMGIVAGIVVRAGFLFHHDLRIPVAEIADFGTDKVHLKITKEAAEGHRA